MFALLRVFSLVLLLQVAQVAFAQSVPAPATQVQAASTAVDAGAPSEAVPAPEVASVESQAAAPAAVDAPRPPATLSSDGGRTRAILVEYLRVDDELNDIEARRRKRRLGPPLSLMIVSSALSVVFGIVTLVEAGNVRDIESDPEDNYYHDERLNDLDEARRVKRGMLGASMAGLSVGIGSAVWFFRNLKVRRPLDASRAELGLRREALKLQLKLQLSGGDFGAIFAAPF